MTSAAVRTLIAVGTLLSAPQIFLNLPSSSPSPLKASRVQEWIDAVEKHEPGKDDDAARTISRWSGDELYELFNEFRALDAFNKNPLIKKGPANNARYPSPQFEKNIMLLLRLTADERRTGNINRLLLRAAVLHTDAQFLVPIARSGSIFSRTSPFSGSMPMTTEDGRRTGFANSAVHIELASWLLDGIRRDTSTDTVVRSWYECVSAVLEYTLRGSDADWILARGRRLFPDDMVLQFFSGTLQESLAAPGVQASLRAPATFSTKPIDLQAGLPELKRAQEFFTKALDIYPGYLDARLHLGRVVGLLGEHQQAIDLLTAVSAKATIAEHRYYSALFLGREQDLAGDLEAATKSFERAAAVYPEAQSPLLALSELSRRRGDSVGARAPLERLLTLSPDQPHPDPYWWYFTYHVADAPARLDQWRQFAIGTSK